MSHLLSGCRIEPFDEPRADQPARRVELRARPMWLMPPLQLEQRLAATTS
jgi:hypothetical protein